MQSGSTEPAWFQRSTSREPKTCKYQFCFPVLLLQRHSSCKTLRQHRISFTTKSIKFLPMNHLQGLHQILLHRSSTTRGFMFQERLKTACAVAKRPPSFQRHNMRTLAKLLYSASQAKLERREWKRLAAAAAVTHPLPL